MISVSVKYSPERYGMALKYQGNEERNGDEDKDKERRQRRKRKEGGKKKERSQEKSRKKKRKMCFIPTSFHRTNQGCFLRFRTMDGCGVLPCFSFQEKWGRGHQAGTGAKNTTDAIFFFPKQKSGTRPHNVGTIPYVLLLDALLTPTVPALPRAASEAPDALLKYCISSTSPLVRYHMPSVRPM